MASIFTYFKPKRKKSQLPSHPSPSNPILENQSRISSDSDPSLSMSIVSDVNQLVGDYDQLQFDMDVESVDIQPSSAIVVPAAPSRSSILPPVPDLALSFFVNKKQPCQPNLESYPARLMGSKVRRFNKGWYKEYKWVEYNQDLDACFCFPCRVFLVISPESVFTEIGFRDWKHAKGTAGKRAEKGKKEKEGRYATVDRW